MISQLLVFSNMPGMGRNTVTTKSISNLLAKLNSSKATGPDQIPIRLLKTAGNVIAPVLRIIYQQSLDSGDLLSDWTNTFVSPIFKKGSRCDPSNYRPISLTCVLCKILEHIISSNIMNDLDQYSLLSPLHHGFRKVFCCESQLVLTIHDLDRNFDNGLQTDLILLDFSKAFDSVLHQRLVSKVASYGIRNHTLSWIKGFQKNRTQVTVVDDESSGACTVTSSVPQGSVLDPLLFLLYINDLPAGSSSQIRLFADDCIVYLELSTPLSPQ